MKNSKINSTINKLAAALRVVKQIAEIKEYFYKGRIKIGAKHDFGEKIVNTKKGFRIITGQNNDDFRKDIINEFNKLPQIKVHRTHGRTTTLERAQIAYFGQSVSTHLIARKFAISTATVRTYANKLEFLMAL